MENNTVNERAKQLLNEADISPANQEELNRMDDLLKQAEAAAEDPAEQHYREKYDEVKGMADWSRMRHRTWLWQIIAGSIVGIGLLWYFNGKREKDAEFNRDFWEAKVAAWTPCDTTITYESSSTNYDINEYASPCTWKAYQLAWYKSLIVEKEQYLEEHKNDANPTDYVKQCRRRYPEEIANCHKKFDEYAAMNGEQIIEYVKNVEKDITAKKAAGAKRIIVYMIIVALMIPLYIWTGYAYGYEINRSRRRNKILGWVRKIGFGLAGLFFAGGLAARLLPDDNVNYVYRNADGGTLYTEHRQEFNYGNIWIMGWKVILMVAGIFIFAFVSIFIMLVEVVAGLRNKLGAKGTVKEAKVIEN